MKIARNVAAFGWSDEWYGSFPAPSLRELLSAAKLRECRPMNGKNPNLLSCVGAMKIARNVAVFGWYDEWYGPFPFIGVLAEIRGWRAIFIAPTKLKSFYIPPLIGGHSLREGAGNAIVWPDAIHRTTQKPQRCGRFSSPLRRLRMFNRPHSLEETKILSFFLRLLCNPADCGKMGQNIPGCPGGGRVAFVKC